MDALSVLAAAGALDSANGSAALSSHAVNIAPAGSPPPQDEFRGCTCKASKCLKLYCVCFAANQPCGKECACRNCHNNGLYPEQKQAAVEAILERNPAAFQPKVSNDSKHNKGCSCRKSGCLKRYCECFNAGVLCSDLCKCITCKNFEGSPDLADGLQSGGLLSSAPSQHPVTPNSFGTNSAAALSTTNRMLAPDPMYFDSSKHDRHTLLLKYGKRSPPHRDSIAQPPAKRVLFQRGPALRSRFGEIGAPGGLHYRTIDAEDDHPESICDAASRVLHPDIVSEAEHDTATFLAMFAQKAAGISSRSIDERGDENDRSASKLRTASSHASRQSTRSSIISCKNTAVASVGLADLYCEESGIGSYEDDAPEGDHREDDEDGGQFASDTEDDRILEDDEYGEDPETTIPSDSSGARSDISAPRPPWYAAAERGALEHCAAILRRVANSSSSSVDCSARGRPNHVTGSTTSRVFDELHRQSISDTQAGHPSSESRTFFARSGAPSTV